MDTLFCPTGVWISHSILSQKVCQLTHTYNRMSCWSKLWLSAIGRQSSMLYTIDRNTGHLQVHALHSGATYVVVDWPADMHYT